MYSCRLKIIKLVALSVDACAPCILATQHKLWLENLKACCILVVQSNFNVLFAFFVCLFFGVCVDLRSFKISFFLFFI